MTHSRRGAVRLRLLRWLEHFFPPDPGAFMSPAEISSYESRKAAGTMGEYLDVLGSTAIDILDFGCGWGGETLWLAERVLSVTGVDIDRNNLAQANALLESSGLTNCRFVLSPDGRLPLADSSFDAVVSTDTFEHVMDLDLAFSELHRVLRPGGQLVSRFGPLFLSPHGYHLYWACKVPWAHILFGLEPILALRAERGGSPRRFANWADLGLNQSTFEDFRRRAWNGDWEVLRCEPIAVRGLYALTHLGWFGNLFIFGVDLHLKKPPA